MWLKKMLFDKPCYSKPWFEVKENDVSLADIERILKSNLDKRPFLYIYKMYCDGLTAEQIANECGITPHSVKDSMRQGCYRLMQTLNRNYKINKIKEEQK